MKFNLFVDTSIQGGFLALYAEAKEKTLLWEGSIADNFGCNWGCGIFELVKK